MRRTSTYPQRSGRALLETSAHGTAETWTPVGISPGARCLEPGSQNLNSDAVHWLNCKVGRKNAFTRDNPKPRVAKWQFYVNANGDSVVWFAEADDAFKFKMMWA